MGASSQPRLDTLRMFPLLLVPATLWDARVNPAQFIILTQNKLSHRKQLGVWSETHHSRDAPCC